MTWLFFRSLFWTLALPGVLGFYLPWRFFGARVMEVDLADPRHWIGIFLVAGGTVLLIACITEFARTGRGTLSPADPPRVLVVRGLYRYVRNPMYLSVTLIILGQVVLTRSPALLGYCLIWFVSASLFVILHEEPWLRRRFGEDYLRYSRAVGRWLPRLTGYHPS